MRLRHGALATPTQYALLCLVTLAAAVLRFHELGSWSFWIDEIYSVGRALAHANLPTILREWWHPSLSNAAIGVSLRLFGVNEWSARLGPALIGIASVPILYVVARRLVGGPAALLAASFLAVSTWHLEWSQNARYLTSQMAFYMLAAFAFFQAVEEGRWRWVALFYVFVLFTLGERFVGASIGPVVLVYTLLIALPAFAKPAGYRPSILAALLLPGIVGAGVDLIRYLGTGSSFFLSWASITYAESVGSPFTLVLRIARSIGIPVLVLGSVAGLSSVLERDRTGMFLVTYAAVPVLLVLLINPVMFTRERYAFVALPAWIMLAGLACWRVMATTRGTARAIAAGFALLVIADSMSRTADYYGVNNGHRLDWRRAFATVESLAQPDDKLVAFWPEFGRFYTRRPILPWASVNDSSIAADGDRYWFVLDSETASGNPALKQWVEQEAELVTVHYLQRGRPENLRVFRFIPGRVACRDPIRPPCAASTGH
jgi:4-amino-4-deoxy-L-arabinose transferase-like glycosyltransferase